jgi:GntR family transcriptional regulator
VIIIVDMDSEIPLYQQIRDRVVEGVAQGQLHAGDPLPSTRQLASDLGINFHTVNKGYDALRAEGMLRLNRKSGAVVQRDAMSGPPSADFVASWEARARTLLAEAVAHGIPPTEAVERCRGIVGAFRPDGEATPYR